MFSMRAVKGACLVAVALPFGLLFGLGAAAQAPPGMQADRVAARAPAGREFRLRLHAQGGTPPYEWQVEGGQLPPGIALRDGELAGTPTRAGEFHFRLTARDASSPRQSVTQQAVITVVGALEIRWRSGPAVRGDPAGIGGEVVVTNNEDADVDLTVIIVAVNEIGRATALGYQRFVMRRASNDGGTAQTIPFGSALPTGRYVVHADAVAEIAARNVIRRARVQSQPLSLP
jgi:hypothetical protein